MKNPRFDIVGTLLEPSAAKNGPTKAARNRVAKARPEPLATPPALTQMSGLLSIRACRTFLRRNAKFHGRDHWQQACSEHSTCSFAAVSTQAAREDRSVRVVRHTA